MKLHSKLMQTYFDYLYNPVYDITTARLNQYRKLQANCIEKLDLCENDKVLCVGLGTGNELVTMLKEKRNINIVGIDYSKTALRKASKKVKEFGERVELFLQDARNLEFANSSFDKVLCIHVMDFVDDEIKATTEIMRTLKNGGRFAITYPSGRENTRMGFKLLLDSIHNNMNSGKSAIATFLESFIQVIAGIVYLPLILRSNRKSYRHSELKDIFNQIADSSISIEEDSLYQDYIVYGNKLIKGGNQDAS